MCAERKSIYLKLTEYQGNPIDEYKKISSFISSQSFVRNWSVYNLLSAIFRHCIFLRSHYTDFDHCVSSNTKNLNKYIMMDFETLPEEIQFVLLDEFLTYCEIIMYVHFTTYKFYLRPKDIPFDEAIYLQLSELIKTSLKSINHDIKVVDEEFGQVIVIKSHPEAEAVAAQSPKDLREAIINYLATRNNDIEEKEIRLRTIIDKLEILLNKYSSLSAISKVKEYAQLFRHPEDKKENPEYKWFFKDKNKYLDEIFMMCIFVKEYDITKNNIKKYEELKKQSLDNIV